MRTGKSGDLSKKMLIALALGFTLWLSYGLLREDLIIAVANAISLGLIAILLGFKWREGHQSP